MRLRPLLGLTLACVPALALLLALGVWQVQRARWKAGLIQTWTAREAAAPAPLGAALCAGGEAAGPVDIDLPLDAREVRVWGAGPQGAPGWIVLQSAAPAPCGRRAFVETAFATLDGARRPASGPLLLEPWPESGPFTPQNEAGATDLYRFDAADLAAAAGIPADSLAPLWARWETRSPVERASITPATHIGYALTWFGLAAALAGVWIAVHLRLGRLSFRRDG